MVLKSKSTFFIGAKHFSSDVGETSGGIEALLYLLSAETSGERKQYVTGLNLGGTVVLAVDATYVANLLLGKTAARENIEIIRFMMHLWG